MSMMRDDRTRCTLL